MNPFFKAIGVIAVMIVGSLAANHVRLEQRSERCLNNVQMLRTSFETSQPRRNAPAIASRIDEAGQLCTEKQPERATQILNNVAVHCVLQNGCRQYRDKVSSTPVFR